MTVDVGPVPAATGRLDVWRDLIRDHFVALDVDAGCPGDFAGRVRTVEVADLRVAEVASIPQRASRTAALARRDAQRWFQVGLLTRGAARLSQDGRTCALRPGDFAVYETDRPFCWDLGAGPAEPWRLLVFTWPREAVSLPESAGAALTARRLRGTTGLPAAVSRALCDLAGRAPAVAAAAAPRLAAETLELAVAAAQAAFAAPAAPEDALLVRIEAYLRANLTDPGLTPDTIAAAHFISTRHLHRLFAGSGRSVGAWLRQERLERCRQELAARRGPMPTVADVGRRWGFGDPAVFSRAFQAAFGTAPSRYRCPGGEPPRGSVSV